MPATTNQSQDIRDTGRRSKRCDKSASGQGFPIRFDTTLEVARIAKDGRRRPVGQPGYLNKFSHLRNHFRKLERTYEARSACHPQVTGR